MAALGNGSLFILLRVVEWVHYDDSLFETAWRSVDVLLSGLSSPVRCHGL